MVSLLRKTRNSPLASAAPALHAARSEAQVSPRATVALLSATDVAAPGQTLDLGLHFRFQPGWHIYWRNAGDAGLPPRLILEEGTSLPEEAVGEFLWPLPHLIPVVEGEIMDYGYDDEVIFAFPVTVPENASGEMRIVAEADYLICESICIPETADVSLTLPVGAPVENAVAGAEIGKIAANGARFLRVHHAPFGWWRHTHDAKEGGEGQIKPTILRPEGQPAGHGLLIHRNMQRAAIGEIFRKRTEKRAEAAKAPIRAEFDFLDIHAQRIAWLRAAHFNRAGDDMRAKPREFGVDF